MDTANLEMTDPVQVYVQATCKYRAPLCKGLYHFANHGGPVHYPPWIPRNRCNMMK